MGLPWCWEVPWRNAHRLSLFSRNCLLTLLGDPASQSPFFHLPHCLLVPPFSFTVFPKPTLVRPFYHHANTVLYKSLKLKTAPQVKVRRYGSELKLSPAVLPKRSNSAFQGRHGNLLTFGSVIHLMLLDQSLLEMVIPYEIKHSEALWWAHSFWVNLWYKRKPRGC